MKRMVIYSTVPHRLVFEQGSNEHKRPSTYLKILTSVRMLVFFVEDIDRHPFCTAQWIWKLRY